MKSLYAALRYFVAFVVINYGFAKLNGAQFTILQSELDKPLGEVSGFWLTWYYFGPAGFYGHFIALVQIGAGVSLLFRKTTLAATCILLAVVTNIILIDILYLIDLGALIMALILETCLVGIAAFHKDELVGLFWSRQNSAFPEGHLQRKERAVRMAARALIVIVPAIFSYYVANYNNRLPTPIDGRWRVVNNPQVSLGQEPLTYVYFERNRAYMCVFRYGAGTWQTHHFELDEKTGKLEIWERWLRKDDEVFNGTYRLSGDELWLDGKFAGSGGETIIELKK